MCRSCSQSLRFEGQGNPNWKGGHERWQKGKYGRDKDGLSWKQQRLLAWTRDSYTCQDCGKTRAQLGRRPDVDHVSPYRLSFSHALSNLLSRCRSCHKKAEATRPELWGGKSLGGHIGHLPKSKCLDCLHPTRKIVVNGRCWTCEVKNVLKPKAFELRARGCSQKEIAEELGVTQPAISLWLRVEL